MMKRAGYPVAAWLLAMAVAAGETPDAAFPDFVTPWLVDHVAVGDGDAEQAHAFAHTGGTEVVAAADGRKIRVAEKEHGVFSYTFALDRDGDAPRTVVARYAGGDDQGVFVIYANGEEIGTQRVWPRHDAFMEYYPIPADVLAKAEGGRVVVRFAPYGAPDRVAGVAAVGVAREKTRAGRLDDAANFDATATAVPGRLVFREPPGPRGERDFALRDYWGLELDVELTGAPRARLTVANTDDARDRWARRVAVELDAPGRRTLHVPFAGFETPKGAGATARMFVFDIDGDAGQFRLHGARMLEGRSVAAKAERYGKTAASGGRVEYDLTLTNTERTRQTIMLSRMKHGWEAMDVGFEHDAVTLDPDEARTVRVTVSIPENLPAALREKQRVRVTPSANPDAAVEVEFVTAVTHPHPFMLHTREGWDAIRAKIEQYDWARDTANEWRAHADRWHPRTRSLGVGREPLAHTREEWDVLLTAYAWQLFRDPAHAEKVKAYLMVLSDPKRGFPYTRRACNQASVQEGHFFQHIAQAFDLILDWDDFPAADREQIHAMFRIVAEGQRGWVGPGGANWAISSQTGAFFSALLSQDFALVDWILHGPSQLMDKFAAYTMADGWWYECTVSYNMWCAEQFTQIGLALRPFGYSLLTQQYPVNAHGVPDFLTGGEGETERRRLHDHGHSFRVLGGVEYPYINIKRMSEALLPFVDYRGVIFGINDSNVQGVGGERMELAYYAYRDPRFAALVQRSGRRHGLLYSVPELPPVDDAVFGAGNAHSDNAGLLLLRSRQAEPRERIQAVLKYGTHGGYHGHFDRTGLLSLMRYGRTFWEPKMVWYGYPSFLYNFYVQTSVSKNMVTVDLKQQEASDSRRSLFHTGDLFQAGAVEVETPWSYPAYGGLRHTMGELTWEQKTRREVRYVPIPDNAPARGELTGFTEPVFQRRLMVVTDDYVLIADAVRAEREHDFDQLFQFLGLGAVEGDRPGEVRHTPQAVDDPLSAGQFITAIDWQAFEGPARATSRTPAGGDDALYVDWFNAWPATKREVWRGFVPEPLQHERWLYAAVKGDGEVLADVDRPMWVLGHHAFDVPLADVKTLELVTREPGRPRNRNAFWGEPALETADGRTIRLADLPAEKTNVSEHEHGLERDYENGPIKISGHRYAWGLPAEPHHATMETPAVYRYDIAGLGAVRFRAGVGLDAPRGDEHPRRVTLGVRQTGREAQFVTVLAPYEQAGEGAVVRVAADRADRIVVTLKDGREHTVELTGLADRDAAPAVAVTERRNGETLRAERTP